MPIDGGAAQATGELARDRRKSFLFSVITPVRFRFSLDTTEEKGDEDHKQTSRARVHAIAGERISEKPRFFVDVRS